MVAKMVAQSCRYIQPNPQQIYRGMDSSIHFLWDKLAELQNTFNYQAKIVESYGYDIYTGEFNEKVFPITKEDKQMIVLLKILRITLMHVQNMEII